MDKDTRANIAKQIQSEPIFQEALDGLKMESYEKLSTLDPTDSDAIREAQALIRAVDGFRDHLSRIISQGPQPARLATTPQ